MKGGRGVTGNKMLGSCMPLSLRPQLFCALVRGAAALQIRELWGTETGLSRRKLGKDRGERSVIQDLKGYFLRSRVMRPNAGAGSALVAYGVHQKVLNNREYYEKQGFIYPEWEGRSATLKANGNNLFPSLISAEYLQRSPEPGALNPAGVIPWGTAVLELCCHLPWGCLRMCAAA